jgi:hypothetical protein
MIHSCNHILINSRQLRNLDNYDEVVLSILTKLEFMFQDSKEMEVVASHHDCVISNAWSAVMNIR